MFSRPHSTTRKLRDRSWVRPQLESLEDRTLLSANTYTVNLAGDAGTGTGLTGDIRYCIDQANNPANAGSTITFAAALNGTTIQLTHGELAISDNMTITGNGASQLTISGNGGAAGNTRVFDITSSAATVSISGLTITAGNASPFSTSVPGNQGGDIFNAGYLTLTSDVVSNGLSIGAVGGPPGRGGGIFNAEGASGTTGATLILDSTIVKGNEAEGAGGGAGGLGAGGGVYNDANATTIVENGSQFLNNLALGSAGAIGGFPGGNGGPAGPAEGGGIFNKGTLQINGTSTTSILFADNVARGGLGGLGAHGYTPTAGPGGNGGDGSNGGAALGGGVYNTSSAITLRDVNYLGNEAIGGAGGNGGTGGNAAGSGLFKGGSGGSAGIGGYAQGGGIYNGTGALTVPNVVFGTDANGLGNEANGGIGGKGGNGGNGSKGGGAGGDAGAAGAAGFARGGAVANLGGDVSFTNTTFNATEANGGLGGNGGNGGNGGVGKGGGPGGAGGNGAIAGAGGFAQAGAVYNQSGNLAITGGFLTASESIGGNGGVGGAGGVGGTGGAGTPGGSGGSGGLGAGGGVGGASQGGGFYNITGTVTVTGTSFTANASGVTDHAASGDGGNGGNGGNGGAGGNSSKGRGGNGGNAGGAGSAGGSGLAEGGAGANQGSHSVLTSVVITSSFAQSGFGGIGGNGGTGGNGGSGPADGNGGAGGNAGNGGNAAGAFGGGYAITASDLNVITSTFGGSSTGLGTSVIGGAGGAGGIGGTIGENGNPGGYFEGIALAGNGGQGGLGASVNGGAISVSGSSQAITISNSTFTDSTITSGIGGAGGAGGRFSVDGQFNGLSGNGANAGTATGGTFSFASTTAQNATLTADTVTGSTATAGFGGAGALSTTGFGSVGGIGGSVQGVGLADVNYNLSLNSTTLDNGTGQAGAGGVGGGASVVVPYSWAGGAGGQGGTVQGGGVYFSNSLPQTTLDFNFNNGSASNIKLAAGPGGQGGNAGASGSKNITGGAGGNGGIAQGGGIYVLTGGNSVTASSFNNLILDGETLNGGTGGIGGSGYLSNGGNGGDASGGSIYNNSVNTTKTSSLSILASTLAGNQVSGGIGGRAGSGTTPNGGEGGTGGNGGNAYGGGLYNDNNTPLTVVNSTFGGPSASSNVNANANILTGGGGGRGGNAGTPANVPANNGGPGGNGGTVEGGNVFIASNLATFINDTIVYGQASSFGLGGAGGGGAGTGGQNGAPGSNGVGIGGGYYAAAGSTNTIGNTIIDLNVAATDLDVAGAFTSMNGAGFNIIGSLGDATGFSTNFGDQIGVTAAQLNLGPLQNNGGPTPTDALQSGSVAINAGNNALVTSPPFTNPANDQRGTGFVRIANGTVDVGAFEVQSPPPPPPPPPGPPGPPAPPPGTNGLTTNTTIVSVQNNFPGLVEVQTITVDVTNPNGYAVNRGVVAISDDGETQYASVVNGVASATFVVPLLDFNFLMELFFSHPLTASYSDSTGVFAPSGASMMLPPILLDFFTFLIAEQYQQLTQYQVN